MNRVAKADILKIRDSVMEHKPDLVAVEEPLEIRLAYGEKANRTQKSVSVTMRTPGHDFELALGFLFTENIISAYNDVAVIKYCEQVEEPDQFENIVKVELKEGVQVDLKQMERHFYTTSSCGVCGKSSIEAVRVGCDVITDDFKTSKSVLQNAPDKLRDQQSIFEHTGGLHAAGLFNASGDLLLMREDVGRHNALDKLIGASLVNDSVPLSHYFVLVSGRTSFELVQKSVKAGVPMLAAVGAPSSLAVSLAKDFGMTLVGFVRDRGFNIYTSQDRVII